MLTIMTVLQFPPNESLSSRVNFESYIAIQLLYMEQKILSYFYHQVRLYSLLTLREIYLSLPLPLALNLDSRSLSPSQILPNQSMTVFQ